MCWEVERHGRKSKEFLSQVEGMSLFDGSDWCNIMPSSVMMGSRSKASP
jgi:hypothetical protein